MLEWISQERKVGGSFISLLFRGILSDSPTDFIEWVGDFSGIRLLSVLPEGCLVHSLTKQRDGICCCILCERKHTETIQRQTMLQEQLIT